MSLLRNFLKAPCTTPAEAVYLELGCINIETIIKVKRLNYLHYLLQQNEESMLYKVFDTQWKYPSARNEWTEQTKKDLIEFGFGTDLSELRKISVNSFKNQVKRKSKEVAFYTFIEKSDGKSKFENLFYTELKMSSYLKDENISFTEAQQVFKFRTRMANFGENFRVQGGATVPKSCRFTKMEHSVLSDKNEHCHERQLQ